ncbi:MAG: glycosyltransferase family 39 protein [Campylobacteraceae bacterium]|jgi:4-amino-4-deoxy-L-arabinose transferase-like glycosyltransferase|nr:glycosyltransferase family 39 protein [Campylobacteraceae bacterium]
MRETVIVFLIIMASVATLIFGISTLSISYYEADIFYNQKGAVHYLVRLSCALFGQNDYALRMPFVLLHAGSAFLLYLVGKPLLKRETDRIISVLIYVLLPGVTSAALLVNNAGIAIFTILLFLFLKQKEQKIPMYVVLFVALFLDRGFIVLYFLLFFYAIVKKDGVMMTVSLVLFAFSAYMYADQIAQMSSGKPRGHFLDTLAIFAAIFSPLLFLYFIYAQYRILVKGGKSLIWWLSFGAFIVSLLLSFRQRVPFDNFAPYLVISTPLLVSTFFNSFRVRLPIYRKLHKISAFLIILFLVLNSITVFTNHYLYVFFDKPKSHFAYKYHVAKDLAEILHQKGIDKIQTDDKLLSLRLKFYGIEEGGTAILKQSLLGDIIIKYANRNIISFEMIDLM